MIEKLKVDVVQKEDKEEFKLSFIISQQKASLFVESLFYQLINALGAKLYSNSKAFFFRTHIRGISGLLSFSRREKAFVYINICQKQLSAQFWTIGGSFPGEENTSEGKYEWSKSFPIRTVSDIPKAIDYAVLSFDNASNSWGSDSRYNTTNNPSVDTRNKFESN